MGGLPPQCLLFLQPADLSLDFTGLIGWVAMYLEPKNYSGLRIMQMAESFLYA